MGRGEVHIKSNHSMKYNWHLTTARERGVSVSLNSVVALQVLHIQGYILHSTILVELKMYVTVLQIKYLEILLVGG